MLSLKILLLFIIIFVLVLLNNNNNNNNDNKSLLSNVDNFISTANVDLSPINISIGNGSNSYKSVIIGDSNLRYNPTVMYDDLTYYENDTINQNNIIETAYDVVNMIDLIDYSKVKTGMEKCEDSHDSNNGICFEGGYTGAATYFPKTNKFDYGTLYKNLTFINGISNN
jgi:hypothetical protein